MTATNGHQHHRGVWDPTHDGTANRRGRTVAGNGTTPVDGSPHDGDHTDAARGCRDGSPVVAAIEAMLSWSSDALAGLIGLGSLLDYLQAGGRPELVAARLRREIDHTHACFDQLPDLLDRLRRAAGSAPLEGPR